MAVAVLGGYGRRQEELGSTFSFSKASLIGRVVRGMGAVGVGVGSAMARVFSRRAEWYGPGGQGRYGQWQRECDFVMLSLGQMHGRELKLSPALARGPSS
jgi:hypothetical protein